MDVCDCEKGGRRGDAACIRLLLDHPPAAKHHFNFLFYYFDPLCPMQSHISSGGEDDSCHMRPQRTDQTSRVFVACCRNVAVRDEKSKQVHNSDSGSPAGETHPAPTPTPEPQTSSSSSKGKRRSDRRQQQSAAPPSSLPADEKSE